MRVRDENLLAALAAAFCVALILPAFMAVAHAQYAEPFSAPGAVQQKKLAPDQPMPMTPPGEPPQPMPPMPGEDAEQKNKEEEAKKKEEEEKKKLPLVTRPAMPPQPPDPLELQAVPDAEGLVQFSFNGQPWPAVLEWFARVSGRTLDWQELPGDYLNLTLSRRYSLDEARDLLNRHLLARGFTFLQHAEGFSVVKIENINPALVPRVRVEDLDKLPPHDFVKVSFDLEWLLAEPLVSELESLRSPNGKLVALKTTNRLEAMDAVVNLREIHRVLAEEQSIDGRRGLVHEFQLVYVKAADVKVQLEAFLGLEAKGPMMPPGMNPEQYAMMQQQMQAQMAAQGQPVPPPAAGGGESDVRIVADSINNRILAHGPPDKMALVRSFIDLINVPSNRPGTLDAFLNRMQVHRLASLDPEQFVKSLNELGGLDPRTKLYADLKNNAVIVDGSLADHFTVKSLIDKLDGSGRSMEVIPLRKHRADEVAGSIEYLMGVGEENQRSRSESRWSFYPFGDFGQPQQERPKDRLRVGANLEYNQLLVWANDVELEEVRQLLIKLGEIPPDRGGSRIRMVEGTDPEQMRALLRQLESAWPSLSPNPLQLPELPPQQTPPDALQPPGPSDERPPSPPLQDTRAPASGLDTLLTSVLQEPRADDSATQDELPLPAEREPSSPAAPQVPPAARLLESFPQPLPGRGTAEPPAMPGGPPVRVQISPDGNLILMSDDVEALNRLEAFLAQTMPPPKSFHVFHLKYAPAYWVKLNLEDFYKDDGERDNSQDLWNSWYWGLPMSGDERRSRQLGVRRPIRFIDDIDTNTIVVQGADRKQLQVIEELILLYDVPEPVNQQKMRVTKLFKIRYSRASVIAATLKDAFIDLLSSNDRALQNQQQNDRPTATVIRNFGPPIPGGEQQQEQRTQITFKGKLSIGVDEVTNSLVVSAEGNSLLSIVGDMIEQLDQAAVGESHVTVIPHGARLNAERLRQALSTVMDAPQSEAAPQPPQFPGYPPFAYPPQLQQPAAPQQPIIIEN